MTNNGNPFDDHYREDYDDVISEEEEEALRQEEINNKIKDRREEALASEEEITFNGVLPQKLVASRRAFWKKPYVLSGSDIVKEEDILGLVGVKKMGREIINLVTYFDKYKDIPNIQIPKGGVLWGSAGNGKTMCLRWLITELQGRCFNARAFPLPTDQNGKTSGWTEADINALWTGAENLYKKKKQPIILIWDEMDAYIRRDKNIQGKDVIAATLCARMDGIEGQGIPIFIIGTANYMGGFEEALTRARRMSMNAECVRLSSTDAAKLLFKNLDSLGMPHPPERHLQDLLGDGDRSGAEIEEAVSRAKIKALMTDGELTESSIGRALLECMIPVPNDTNYTEAEREEDAWHEVGHALFAHALGLRLQRIDIHSVAANDGSIVLSEKAIQKQIDGFCYAITGMGGKMMEVFIYGEEGSSLFGAIEDYRSLVNHFTESIVQSGGRVGRSFDWKALADRMEFVSDHRAQLIDTAAQSMIEKSYQCGADILDILNSNGTLKESLSPFISRLMEEGIILGSDAFDEIEKALINRPFGWYHGEALIHWKNSN